MTTMLAASELEVNALDECVHVRMRNDEGTAYMMLDVEEAEQMIEWLKEAIDDAKKSKWYTGK